MAVTIGCQRGEYQFLDGDASPERRITLIAAFPILFPRNPPRKAPQTRPRREDMAAVARSAAVRARGGYNSAAGAAAAGLGGRLLWPPREVTCQGPTSHCSTERPGEQRVAHIVGQ